jgi:D-3-phosphoglycerate dehydrogenase
MIVLIADQVSPQCGEILRKEGFTVDDRPGMAQAEFLKAIAGAHALIVRSQTTVSAAVMAAAPELKIIGRAGAGVDNIDVDAATRQGIIVMNTPGGNTVSTAEHTMALLLAMARNISPAHQSLAAGRWDRKKFTGTELQGKTVGILGLGKVGSEVAKRCQAFGMRAVAFDPLVNSSSAAKAGIELVTLEDLYVRADIITVHSPLTPETTHLLDAEALKKCKQGVRIINCARGGIVDEVALLAALESHQVAGAALDVYEHEPPENLDLIRHPHVVATPHLGASTEEAQEQVALQIARQVADALAGRGIAGAVNADAVRFALRKDLHPYFFLAEKIGSLVSQLKKGALHKLTVGVSSQMLDESLTALGSAVLKGLFESSLEERVNYVNALVLARERDIRVEFHRNSQHPTYTHVLTVSYKTDAEERRFAGTVFGQDDARIVGMDEFHVELQPRGHLLVYLNIDRPGMLASVSRVLASSNINIASLSLGRFDQRKDALTIVVTDTPVGDRVLHEIASIDGVSDIKRASL